MRRVFLVLLAAVLCGVAFLPMEQARAEGDRDRVVRLHGVIAGVGDRGIVLHTRRGDVNLFVVERTQIFLNGERVRLGALQRGDHARVVARWVRSDRGPRLVALRIYAFRRR